MLVRLGDIENYVILEREGAHELALVVNNLIGKNWASHHQVSENHAIQAELHMKHGNLAQARQHYAQAAAAEQLALDALDPAKRRTLSITTVSAAALWYKAAEYQNALQVAYAGLARGTLPEFATTELKALLQTIWSEDLLRQSHVEFTEGEVLVAVSGGEVVIGGAPLDLIMRAIRRADKNQKQLVSDDGEVRGPTQRERGVNGDGKG